MSWVGVAIAAGVGLTKTLAVDLPKEKRQRKLAARTQELSPWTGMQAGPIQEADFVGNTLAYGMTGAQLGQGMRMDKRINDYLDANPTANPLGLTGVAPLASVGPGGGGGYLGAGGGQPAFSLMPSAYKPNLWSSYGGGG